MSELAMTEVLDLFTTEQAPTPTRKKRTAKGTTDVQPEPVAPLAPFQPSRLLSKEAKPFFVSSHGALFDGDCLAVLPQVLSDSIDTVFADPPFNLDKKYGAKSKDNLSEQQYVAWCKAWLDECIRVLRPGGSLFLYNLPRWNIVLGAYLMEKGLTFRHDITVAVNSTMPIAGRLYPSH